MRKKIILLLCIVLVIFILTSCDKSNDLGIESGEYEVVSVYQYPSTGKYWGRMYKMPEEKIYYKIDYIDKYGNLQTVENFREIEDNGWKIELSNTDMDEFIVDGNECCLYLTKETLKGMSGSGIS